MAARVYICDDNPRMRQLIEERLRGAADVVGTGRTPEEAVAAAAELEPDLVVLDFRTAVANLAETIDAIKGHRPSAAVIVHSGVPRHLIEDQIRAAGGAYAAKHEPEQLLRLVRSVRPAAEAASRDSSRRLGRAAP